jgi:hypothetical protein
MGMLTSAAPKPAAKKAEAGKLSPEAIKAQMHLDPKQAQQLDRIVLAGRKVMYSPESHKLMLKELEGPGTIAQKIGQGVAGLMALLWQESKQSIPPQLLIPAGMVLVADAAQFLKEAGQDVTDQDIGQAMEAMMSALFHAGGVDPEKLAEIGGGGGKMAAPAAKAAPKPGAMA